MNNKLYWSIIITCVTIAFVLITMMATANANNNGQCFGDCAMDQSICIGNCDSESDSCIPNCMAAYGRCVSRCN